MRPLAEEVLSQQPFKAVMKNKLRENQAAESSKSRVNQQS